MSQPSVSMSADRFERIAAIRREIAAGTYETPEKLAAALEAFLGESDTDCETADPPQRPR